MHRSQQKSMAKKAAAVPKTSTTKHPLKAAKRQLSKNKKGKLVSTKKRLMLEVPSTPTIQEVGSASGMTSFDIPTTTVAFTHPLPSVEVADHPLIPKPTTTAGQVFAVVDINGAQHKVAKDDQVMVNHLKGLEIGEQIALDHVFLIGGRDFSVLGKPYVPNVQVLATIEQHTLLAPVTVWKYKRRTGYRNLNRHRDHVTILRIDDILIDEAQEFIPQVTSLDTIPLNHIQEGGKLLESNQDV